MKHLKDVLKFSPKNDDEAVFKLVVGYIKSQRAQDEYLLCDKTPSGNWLFSIENSASYRSFWYSHQCEGGCYDPVFTFYLPTWESPFVRITPSIVASRKGFKTGMFSLIDPEALEMKRFIRQIFDAVKENQGRSPRSCARIDLR